MSKPLSLILQLAGMFLIIFGLPGLMEGNLGAPLIGLILVIIGGIGFRSRIKKKS